jgi:tyrosine-protein kinase Etk/Wzc
MLEAKNNIVVIAGPAPGIGKSFVSANLAAVLAMGGKRVLLIDADMRRGHLHDAFGVSRDVGLSGLILESSSSADAIHRNVVENLDFVATGRIPQNPSELLLRPGLKQILENYSTIYDIVLIDSPPILAVSDAATVAAFAGSTFIVARYGVTRLGEIAEAKKRLAQNGTSTNGVIFNGVNPKQGRYGYGARYGNYRYATYEYGGDRGA